MVIRVITLSGPLLVTLYPVNTHGVDPATASLGPRVSFYLCIPPFPVSLYPHQLVTPSLVTLIPIPVLGAGAMDEYLGSSYSYSYLSPRG